MDSVKAKGSFFMNGNTRQFLTKDKVYPVIHEVNTIIGILDDEGEFHTFDKDKLSQFFHVSESFIGKLYRPFDNSYQVNLTSACNYPYKNEERRLAGNYQKRGEVVKIVSEPFQMFYNNYGKKKSVTMIMVEFEEETHAVMFHSQGII